MAVKRTIRFDDDDETQNSESVEQIVETKIPAVRDPVSDVYMYLQGEIVAKSTMMSTLNQQMQRLQGEINERQNAIVDIRTKMVNAQGAVATLHAVSGKFRDLKLVSSLPPLNE
jgi:uncharacterized coiled-coil DUF342 family protein